MITDAQAVDLWKGKLGEDGKYTGGLPFSKIKSDMKAGGRTKRFKTALGGSDEMAKLRALGCGGQSFFGGRAPAAPVDDSKVRVVTAAPIKDGWKVYTLLPSRDDVIVDPKGNEYVRAKDSEPADLIYEGKTGRVRYRNLRDSRLGKKNAKNQKKEDKQVTHLEKKKEAKAKRKAAKKAKTAELLGEAAPVKHVRRKP